MQAYTSITKYNAWAGIFKYNEIKIIKSKLSKIQTINAPNSGPWLTYQTLTSPRRQKGRGALIGRKFLTTSRVFSLEIWVEPSQIILPTIWFSKLWPMTCVHLALCRDEFHGPRSDNVRQVTLETTALPIRYNEKSFVQFRNLSATTKPNDNVTKTKEKLTKRIIRYF
ncbi:UNVERIFIED_CONTAM: hypothetical protein NCL1_37213 [Trichonephila clavipes]